MPSATVPLPLSLASRRNRHEVPFESGGRQPLPKMRDVTVYVDVDLTLVDHVGVRLP